ncbi:MAG: serine/threonine protein kinase [Deltaproteobacteria bacterium]|nr:serine/threonine protein kinase [Deltaproteobacteria bacterium]
MLRYGPTIGPSRSASLLGFDETVTAASGLRIGRFEILGHFASGGTAELWVAIKDGSKDVCLLKQLSAEFAQHELAQRRLMREAQIAFRLDHPNVGRVLTAGVEGGRFCLSTDFIRGQSVAAILKTVVESGRGAVPAFVAIPIAIAVLDGLTYLHELREEDGRHLELVHRDLTPGNIMVGFDGRVRIIDFGTARARIDDFRTAPGVVLGTPEYMSPEQALGESVDRRSDLYSLGIVLHEMLTGKEMIRRGLNLVEVLQAVRSATPAPISSLNPTSPARLDPIIARALSKRPEERWQSAAEMKAALLGVAAEQAATPAEAVGRYLRELMPHEERRIDELLEGAHRSIAMRELGEGTVTQAATGGGDQEQLRTQVVRDRRASSTGRGRAASGEKTAVVARKTAHSGAHDSAGDYGTPAVMEMPGTGVIRMSTSLLIGEAKQLRQRVRLWRLAFLAMAACLLAAVAVIVSFVARRPQEGLATSPRAAIERPPAPAAGVGVGVGVGAEPGAVEEVAADPAIEAPPLVAPSKARATRAKPTRGPEPERAETPPPPPVTPPPPPATTPPPDRLASMMKELQAAPKNARLFEEVMTEIARRAKSLPDDRRSLVLSDLKAAERTFDLDHLREALRKLNRG